MAKANQSKGSGQKQPLTRRCGTQEVHMRLLMKDSEYARRRALVENQAWRARRTAGMMGRSGYTSIPVVVHVVYSAPAENITQAQIDSQIAVLNEDFRAKNADLESAPAAFRSLAGDARLQFELATLDPDGNPTNGVTRTSTTVSEFDSDDAVKSSATGGADAWPADRYLNIWVCNLAGGLLGYAQFPGGPPSTDGVVITYTAFGTTGTATAPFNRGRTTVHEIGHWLNLRHIWGDDGDGCSGSDFVDDTPNQAGPNLGKPTFPSISCGNGPNGDMFMNYMDYVDDEAMVMFTNGQVERMHAVMDGFRSTIGQPIPGPDIPKLKALDDPQTIKFSDDGGKLKFVDDPNTLKFIDDPGTTKFSDDLQSLKFLDDGKLKFIDDPGTLKVIDDQGPGKLKALDDVKQPVLDKTPGSDLPGQIGNPGPGLRGPSAAPFILATPHHSNAWQQTYPGAARAEIAALEQQLRQLYDWLSHYAQAEQAGAVSPQDQTNAQQAYAQYSALLQQYQSLSAGR